MVLRKRAVLIGRRRLDSAVTLVQVPPRSTPMAAILSFRFVRIRFEAPASDAAPVLALVDDGNFIMITYIRQFL